MPTKQPLSHPVNRVKLSNRSYLIAGFISMTGTALIALYAAHDSGCLYLSAPVIVFTCIAYISFMKLMNTWRMPKLPETKAFQVNKYYPELMENEL